MFDPKTYGLAVAVTETRAALHHARLAQQGYVSFEPSTREAFADLEHALALLISAEDRLKSLL